MEECNKREEVQTQSSSRLVTSLKSATQHSPSFQRSHSSFTPRRENKGVITLWFLFFVHNKLLYWLLLITLWAYLGFFVQSMWAHHDNNLDYELEHNHHQDFIVKKQSLFLDNEKFGESMNVALAKKEENVVEYYEHQKSSKKRSRRSLRSKSHGNHKRKMKFHIHRNVIEKQEMEIPLKNATYGFLVGPFDSIEERILQLNSNSEKGYGKCNKEGEFGRVVWSKKFMLIFHELSMTGAPISMMELATELLNCGAIVSAVVLSKKGGLMNELVRREIKVLDDKGEHSFNVAFKADLVIAGSAVCASWIEQYIEHFPVGANQVVWWIMENRREYFDRSKDVLHKVKMLIFLSESQLKQWRKWCEEESIKLRSKPEIVPLSVNDELAYAAGIYSSLSAEKMDEKRKLLRESVRREMNLTDNDMLVISLSSINPGKGQLLLLESANSIVEHEPFQDHKKMKSQNGSEYLSTMARRNHIRNLLPLLKDNNAAFNNISSNAINRRRKVLSHKNEKVKQSLKVLIGSVGSKSNKLDYVKGLLNLLGQHSNLSKSVLWTPATTHVASLYSAADVYAINSQGLGETFGRVTIEAMAFGLPVVGTDAGGTKEIVEHNVTGLHHPIGRVGNHVLAQNLRFLLENRLVREKMGMNGRKKVQSMYLKQHMYSKFVKVLLLCMRNK